MCVCVCVCVYTCAFVCVYVCVSVCVCVYKPEGTLKSGGVMLATTKSFQDQYTVIGRLAHRYLVKVVNGAVL